MDNTKNIEQYAEYMRGRGKVRDSTLQMYVYALKQFFTGMNGDTLSTEFIQNYIDKMSGAGLSPSTVNLRAHAIMSYFKWKEVKLDLICPSVRTKKPEYLKQPEVNRAIKACNTQLERTLVVMLYDTAVRISELLNLKLDDVDWETKTINVVRKGGRETEVNISTKALNELKAWLSERRSSSKKVFMDLDYYTAWQMIKSIGKRAEVPNMHPHIFRHSRAISMLKAGVKPYVVQQHLGHRSIATTLDIYGAFLAVDLKEEIPEW